MRQTLEGTGREKEAERVWKGGEVFTILNTMWTKSTLNT